MSGLQNKKGSTYQVVLVEEGVHMFEEGDGRRAMDDPVHLSMQLRQLMRTQPAVRLAGNERKHRGTHYGPEGRYGTRPSRWPPSFVSSNVLCKTTGNIRQDP